MRYRLPALITVLLLVAAWQAIPARAAEPQAAPSEPLEIEVTSRKLDAERPKLERVGPLRSLGVLELTSPDPRFGGLSGLVVSADGSELGAVTNQGNWVAARLLYDSEGRLTGLSQGRIAALRDRKGQALKRKFRKDAESLAPDGDGLLVSFEHDHRIWRYPRRNGTLGSPPTALTPPPDLDRQPANEGIESLERLADGRLLAIGSKTAKKDHYPAFLRQDGGAWETLWYRRTADYEPTGAALLPDGDLLVLERHFSLLGGLAVRLMRVEGSAIQPGATLVPTELARLRPPLIVDNLEGVAARQGPTGETLVYLLSDDNFNPLQRTLLMLFVLEG